MSNFKIIAKEGQARAGVLKTAHGEIETPVYMPVGTQGTVKALTPDDLKELGAQIILGNTYHLNLRPTSELIKKMGGLHKFMGWGGPILTDSGGFQAFSLGAMIEHGIKKVSLPRKQSDILRSHRGYEGSHEVRIRKSGKVYDTKAKTIHRHVTVELKPNKSGLVKITEEGVEFKSHLDGGKHMLTPERSIEIQLNIGSDICLVLDELISPLHSKSYVAQSLERTHRWEQRSLQYYKTSVKKNRENRGMIFGILQGVDDKTIRSQEARWIANQDFDGVSIGGSFGTSPLWSESASTLADEPESSVNWASTKSIEKTMSWITPLLPDSWPRHALGIGEIVDLFLCIEKGVDMFDCVSPTRRARNGSLYISPKNKGRIKNKFVMNIGNAEFALDVKPIDPGCQCYTCQNFSRGYLRHLFMARELLYFRLASIHNLYFVVNLVKKIRQSIIEKQFKKLKKKWLG